MWTGVLARAPPQEAGLKKKGTWIVAEGTDAGELTKSIPIDKALDDVFVAYGQNGEAVRPENGYPLRLMVPGFEGLSHVKWLRRIKVVDEPYQARSESTGYSILRPNLNGKAFWFNFEMGPKSVITRPSAGLRMPGRGFCEITGLAWSGGGAIRGVDVSTDGGRTWRAAGSRSRSFDTRTRGSRARGRGMEKRPSCSRGAPMSAAMSSRRCPSWPGSGESLPISSRRRECG